MNAFTKIGVIGAMDVEVEGIVNAMERRSRIALGGSEFFSGTVSGREVVTVQSGIGKVNAAFAASALALRFEVDSVFMTGVAGGISGDLDPLDAFVPDGFVQHDVAMIGCADGHIDIVNGIVLHPNAELADALARTCDAKRGIMATGERFVDDADQISAILAKFPETKAVDMEAAAVAQICSRLGLPFACVKIISDDGTSGDTYYAFKTAAADKAVGALVALIGEL